MNDLAIIPFHPKVKHPWYVVIRLIFHPEAGREAMYPFILEPDLPLANAHDLGERPALQER